MATSKESHRRLPRSAALLGWILPLLVGCGGDDDCEIVCDKNVECQVDSPGRQACLDLCEELSEDAGYAEALEQQADCYEDATCDEISSGGCTPEVS